MKHYEEIKVLGDGAFGTVTKAKDRESGELVAIKKMKQRFTSFEECLQLKEVKSLRKMKHENVMKLLSVFRENDHLYLVFELLGESLLHTMNTHIGLFDECEIRYIMHEILQGLNFIHRQGFFHRDLKPDNLLWSLDGSRLKLCDFGLAREIRSRPPYSEYVGTRWYRAPEIILRHEFYNSPVDIWAAGCIFAELYLGKTLFQGNSETDQIIKICNILGTPSQSTWADGIRLANKRNLRLPQSSGVPLSSLLPNASPDAITLIQDMLRYDPMKRPSASQCLKYPFFEGEMYSPLIPRTQPQTQTQINSPENTQNTQNTQSSTTNSMKQFSLYNQEQFPNSPAIYNPNCSNHNSGHTSSRYEEHMNSGRRGSGTHTTLPPTLPQQQFNCANCNVQGNSQFSSGRRIAGSSLHSQSIPLDMNTLSNPSGLTSTNPLKPIDFSFGTSNDPLLQNGSSLSSANRGFCNEYKQPSSGALGIGARPILGGLPHHRRNVSFDSGKTTATSLF